jgi:hypothetical protein
MTNEIRKITVPVNDDEYLVADKWIAENGYSVSAVIESLFKYISANKRLPDEIIENITYPERYLKLDEIFDSTYADYKAGKIKGYKDIAEMRRDLDAEIYSDDELLLDLAEAEEAVKNKTAITYTPDELFAEWHNRGLYDV